jgi:NADPH-dependent glutamate synthase beta subunit-like oxidoreductase
MKGRYLDTAFDNDCWPSARISAPCALACPVGTDASAYIMAIHMGQYDEAFRIIARENPLPSVCGRVCHHPCETQCVRAEIDEPIAIRGLKRFAIEQASDKAKGDLPRVSKRSGLKVTVVGSGPSGLSAAYELAVMGHEVEVLERDHAVGGLLAKGIPPFVLPPSVLREDLHRIASLGVDFRKGVEVRGKEDIERLFARGSSAVLLAAGASRSLTLGIPGAPSQGIETGLDFLRRMARRARERIEGSVVVIGGGNVAMDVARLCVRKGAGKVHVYFPEERDRMTAFPWERERAEREGVVLHPGWGLKGLARTGRGRILASLVCVTEILPGEGGAVGLVFDEKRVEEVEADRVILAVGQKVEAEVWSGLGFEFTPSWTLRHTQGWAKSDRPGLFATGDMAIYPGTVSECIASGKRAARGIDAFLKGEAWEAREEARGLPGWFSAGRGVLSIFPIRRREPMPEMSPEKARRSLQEVEKGFSKAAAAREASRCLNCSMCSLCMVERRQICMGTAQRLSGGLG